MNTVTVGVSTMPLMKTDLFAFSVLAAVLGLAGCQSANEPFAKDPDAQRITLGDGGKFTLKSAEALRGYQSVYLDSVVANPAPGTGIAESSDVTALEYAFENAFRSTVGSSFPLVQSAGPKTLTVTATIDNVVFTGTPTPMEEDVMQMDLDNSLYPDDAVGAPFIFGSNAGVGDIILNLQLADSTSGEVLAVLNDESFGNGINTIGGLTSWARVQDAFNRWGTELESQLLHATAQ